MELQPWAKDEYTRAVEKFVRRWVNENKYYYSEQILDSDVIVDVDLWFSEANGYCETCYQDASVRISVEVNRSGNQFTIDAQESVADEAAPSWFVMLQEILSLTEYANKGGSE